VLDTRYTLVSATGEGVRHTEPPLRTRLITPVEGTPSAGVFLFPAAGGRQAVLSDVERVCDFLVVLDRGRLAAAGPVGVWQRPTHQVCEVRAKGGVAGFVEALRAGGLAVDVLTLEDYYSRVTSRAR